MHHLFSWNKAADIHAVVAKGEISDVRVQTSMCEIRLACSTLPCTGPAGRSILHTRRSTGETANGASRSCRNWVRCNRGELLDRRAKSCVQDKDGNTPLHLAAAGGHVRCAQLLLSLRNTDQQRHIPLQLKNCDGFTPLLLAAASGHAAVVDVLLKSGVDMYSNILPGRVTAGHLAARNGHVQVLGVLASHGFDLNSDTLDMTSLLHDAAQHGQVAAVACLLRAGVNPSVKNFDGKTAQDLARAEEHHAVVQQLQQAAAVAAANSRSGSTGGSGQSTPTAAAADGARQAVMGQQQQQQHWQVYPENEQYKNYPTFNRVGR